MSTKIYFDMDGTVYDLYGVQNWLAMLRNEDVAAYSVGKPLFGDEFYKTVSALMRHGVKFGVITWLSMKASPEYAQETAEVKRQWVKEYLPFVETFTAQDYGMPKQQAITHRTKNDILIDDNAEVLKVWENGRNRTGRQVTAEKTVTEILKEILQTFN